MHWCRLSGYPFWACHVRIEGPWTWPVIWSFPSLCHLMAYLKLRRSRLRSQHITVLSLISSFKIAFRCCIIWLPLKGYQTFCEMLLHAFSAVEYCGFVTNSRQNWFALCMFKCHNITVSSSELWICRDLAAGKLCSSSGCVAEQMSQRSAGIDPRYLESWG